MSVTAIDRRARRSRARLTVAVLGLLLGLLGMHALSLHGVDATPPADQAGLPAAEQKTHTASHASHEAVHWQPHAGAPATNAHPAAATAGTASAGGSGGHDDHGSGAMLVLCLAVLAAALSLLWPHRARGLRHRKLPRITRTRVSPPRSTRLGTGPPPVWQFSVIRC